MNTEKKHIVFLINDITKLGGTERMCTLICNKLDNLGYKITIVSLYESNSEPFFTLNKTINRISLFSHYLSKFNTMLLPFHILKMVRNLGANLFISCDTQMCLYSSLPLLGKHHFAWEHFNSSIVTLFGSRWFGRRMASFFCKKIIVLTETDRDNWVKKLHTKKSKLCVIPNPLPIERLCNEKIPKRTKTVLAIGRMTEQKGFDLLIQAWAKIDESSRCNWKLRIVGPNGSAKPQLEKLIIKHKLENNVELASESKQVDLEYQNASIYVLSSRYEGFGLTLIEAMSQGLPIIAFDCPMGPSEIIDNKYGILLPANDITQLAHSMKQFLVNEKLRESYGQLAYIRSEKYSKENIIKLWETIIKSA